MGTRADFYKENPDNPHDLIWVASIAWDGYPDGISITKRSEESTKNRVITEVDYLTDCETEEAYEKFLTAFLSDRDDVTFPQMGWPWPWEDSRTTDYAYVFSLARKEVLIACYGRGWFNSKEWEEVDKLPEAEYKAIPKLEYFPDMTSQMKVTFGKRSGLMVFESTRKETNSDNARNN